MMVSLHKRARQYDIKRGNRTQVAQPFKHRGPLSHTTSGGDCHLPAQAAPAASGG